MKPQVLKSHYRKGNRYFFRHKKQRMVIEEIIPGKHYIYEGDRLPFQIITSVTVHLDEVILEERKNGVIIHRPEVVG